MTTQGYLSKVGGVVLGMSSIAEQISILGRKPSARCAG